MSAQSTRQPGAAEGAGQLSSAALTLGGVILIGLGLYFIFIRPALLPEDPRFMVIDSDFKWRLLALTLPWLVALSFYARGR